MNIYTKNLTALKKNRLKLYEQLQKIESNDRFEVFLPENGKYANILDTKNEILFFEDAQFANKTSIAEFEKMREYPFLYLFGVSNAKVAEALLKNKKLEQLIVFEPNIELIYIAFNLIDFSKELSSNRLLVLGYEEVDYSLLINLIHVSNAKYYIRNFHIFFNGDYYEKVYLEEYKKLFSLFLKALDYVAQANGNDLNDTFRGLKQHINNLDLMLEHSSYQSLLKTKNSDFAVIVSTGPSLTQQIPLLKKYQDKITIISVDASFPILVKNGIKPDIVVSMERDTPTAKFFQVVEACDQDNIVFLCVSLQHKEVFESIKSGTMVIAMRPFAYNTYLNLDEFGYVCKGMSSANMAHELASAMQFENCTFIGQDLAFAEGLKTHAEGHVITKMRGIEQQIKEKKLFEVEAYGGDAMVTTNVYWNMFKNFIEHHIEESSNFMTTYNSTEGGARIKGAVEKPFSALLEIFAIDKKTNITLDQVDEDKIAVLKKSKNYKLKEIREKSMLLQNSINDSFLLIAKECELLEHKEIEEAVEVFSMGLTISLLEEISKIRNVVDDSEIYTKFLSSIIQPLMYSMELEIAEIKVKFVDNPKDNQIKALQWILAHRYWLFSFSGVIENVIHVIDEALELQD